MAASSSPTQTPPTPIAEIDHGPSKFDEFLDKHTLKLVLLAILLALAVIAYVIYSGLAEAKAEAAGSALLSAETISDYQDVINKWPASKAAASALPVIADLQWKDSQADSTGTLEEFLDKNSTHPVAATAQVSLGLRLLEQGKTNEAIETLTEVADGDASYIAPLACIALGDIAKATGKIDEAIAWYKKAQEDPSEQGNTFTATAATRLALANASPPKKIKPAPPAPPIPEAPAPLTLPKLIIPDTSEIQEIPAP